MIHMHIEKLRVGWLNTLLMFVGIMLMTLYISTNWYQLVLIRGDSMLPTYHNMQLVLMDRHSEDYTYDDVIVFWCNDLKSVLTKRIVACPGDEVLILDGILYVNDEVSSVFSEEYLFEYAGIADNPVRLTIGQYFVIGDNIEKSKDSRYPAVGCVSVSNIKGKVIKNIQSLSVNKRR